MMAFGILAASLAEQYCILHDLPLYFLGLNGLIDSSGILTLLFNHGNGVMVELWE